MTNPDPTQFDLTLFLPFELHQASEAISNSFGKIYRDGYGMTRTEWRVFAHLGQSGTMTATEIGRASKLHKTKVSRAVFSLEKRLWLVRTNSVDDRRVQSLSLSDLGKSTYQELSAKAMKFNRQLKDRLGTEEFEHALSLLDRLQTLE